MPGVRQLMGEVVSIPKPDPNRPCDKRYFELQPPTVRADTIRWFLRRLRACLRHPGRVRRRIPFSPPPFSRPRFSWPPSPCRRSPARATEPAALRCASAHTSRSSAGSPRSPARFRGWLTFSTYRGNEGGQCSGTVVAPNLVLTAGHCAEDMQTGVVNEASGYRVTTGNVDWARSGSGKAGDGRHQGDPLSLL